MYKIKYVVMIIIVYLSTAVSAVQFFPIDQASQDKSFVFFRNQLMQAIDKKDLNFLLKHISSEIMFSYGDIASKSGFIKFWQLDTKPHQSELWADLKNTLILGGQFESFDGKRHFIAPYTYFLADHPYFKNKDYDPYTFGVIVGTGVRLREQSSLKSKILQSFSYEIVEVIYQEEPVYETINGETHYWAYIKTAQGLEGFIYSKYLRVAIDYRAIFSQDNGIWKMTTFIAGD